MAISYEEYIKRKKKETQVANNNENQKSNVKTYSQFVNGLKKASNNQNKKTTGYIDTGKKYGDYSKVDYDNKKDYKIYSKDDKYYYYNTKANKYVLLNNNTNNEMVSADKVAKKTTKTTQKTNDYSIDPIKKTQNLASGKMDLTGKTTAVKQNKKSDYDKLSLQNKIKVDTANITEEEKKEYASQLRGQEEVERQQKLNKYNSSTNPLSNMLNTAKTRLGSTATTTSYILNKGMTKGVEGLMDAGATVGAFVTDKIGQKEASQNLKNWVKENRTESVTKLSPKDEVKMNYAENNSIIKRDNLGGMVVENVGQMIPTLVLGGVGGKTAAYAVTGLTGLGMGSEEALNEGATIDQATLYGIASGAKEIVTEWITGGVPGVKGTVGGGLDKLVAKGLGQETLEQVSSSLGKSLIKSGYKMAGEGLEEGISEALTPLLKNAIYSQGETINWENVIQNTIIGAITAGVLNAPSSISDAKASVNNSNTSKATFDNILQTRIKKAKKENSNLTDEEIKQITTETKEDVKNGNLSIDEIEETFGGETYQNYKKILEQQQELKNQIEELDNMPFKTNKEQREIQTKINELEKKLEEVNAEPYRYQLNQEMLEKTKNNSVLQKSYEEYGKGITPFTYEVNENDSDLVKNVYKSAEIMNDTQKAHNLVDMVAKISNDTGVQYQFTNTEGLKDSGYNLSGKVVINGVTTADGKVLINIDSANAFNRIVGHETTHLFENTEDYKTLQNEVFEYAKMKGEYDARRKEIIKTYKGVNANIDNELTSDLIGDYLFSDEKFVKQLSKNKNIFQKIYDKIKQLYKMATAGSKEKRQLEKVKRTFEKVYRDNKAKIDGKNKYMMTGIKGIKNDVKINHDDKIIIDWYNKAKQMKKQGYSNEEIRKKTGWFQDREGKWKFEISDHKARLLIEPKKNTTYKLSQLLKHNDLYEMYPKLKKIEIKFKYIKNNVDPKTKKQNIIAGYYNPTLNTISMNNRLIDMKNGQAEILNTFLHETQHIIQKTEGFNHGYPKSDIETYNINLGEQEAFDTERRRKLDYNQRRKIAPVSSILEKNGQEVYNSNRGANNEETNSNNKKILLVQDNQRNNTTPLVDRGGKRKNTTGENQELENSSFSLAEQKQIKYIDGAVLDVTNKLSYGDKVTDQTIDEIVEESPYYKENYIDVDEVDIDELELTYDEIENKNRDLYDKVYDQLSEKLNKEGISLRYDEKNGMALYDRQELAKKGYNEMLDYFDGNNVSYEISRSTEAGYVPSVYIKNANGETIYRIANHDNGYVDAFDMVYDSSYNKIFTDKDYANWKENILPYVEKEIGKITDTKYSLSDTDIKQKQLDIILKSNPAFNETSTWIRKVEDIKTFEETLQDEDYKEYYDAGEDFDETYTVDMAKKALDSGKITVYSSYPIEQGIFVSPSRMEAESYSGNGKVYSKEVNLTDVAWIDPTQGQYAKVNNKYSLSNKEKQSKKLTDFDITREDVKIKQAIDPLTKEIKQLRTKLDNVNKQLQNPKLVKNNSDKKTTANLALSNNVKKVNLDKAIKTDANNMSKVMNNMLSTKESTNSDWPELKLRKWIETSTESEVVDHKLIIEDMNVLKATYEVKTNKASLEKANRQINLLGYDKALESFNSKLQSDTLPTAEEVIMGERLLQKAIQKNDMETAKELIENISIMGTELGQATQALSVIKKLTPEGQLKMLVKVVQRAKTKGNKAFEDVEITPEMVEKILKTYQQDGTWKQEELDEAVEQVKQDIADQLKVSVKDKIDEWRYLAMLGNPKTHIRNLVSNVAMKGTLAYKNAIARTLEGTFNINNKTKTWKRSSDVVKQFAEETTIAMKDDITGQNKYNEKVDIESKKTVYKNKFVEGMRNFNSNALQAEDWFFSKGAFKNSFEEYLTANNIMTRKDIDNNPEIIEKAKAYALNQAEIATFRQYSWMANKIGQIENKNIATKLFVGAVMPFKKTPINIAKTGLSYSPLGLAKSISYDAYMVKTGKMEASQLIDNLSQGLTGTSLLLIGYALAKAGFLLGSGDDDKEGKYDKALGDQGYALKIGDNTYSISWLSPIAMPLLEGATFFNTFENQEEWDMNVVIDTLAKTLDPLSEMSFLSSLDDALSSYDSGMMKFASIFENAGQSYVTQFFPTVFSQLASTLDDKKRSTTASKNSKFKFGEETVRQIMYKIPGLRNKLEVSTDIWGNEREQADNVLERAFESFLAPYTRKEDISTGLDDELKTVYKATDDSGVIPGTPYSYLNYDGEKYQMSASEYTRYKKTYGQNANKYLNSLIQNNVYLNATNEEKASMIGKMYDYAKAEANEEYFSDKNVEYSSNNLKTIKSLHNLGMGVEEIGEYSALTTKANTIKNDGNLTSEEKKIKTADLMVSSNLTDKQLGYTYSKFYSSEDKIKVIINSNIPIREFIKFDSQDFKSSYDSEGNTIKNSKRNAVIKYVNSLNLSIPQKAMLIKSEYSSYNKYDNQIMNYIEKQNMDFLSKAKTVKTFGFTKYDKSIINYVKNNYSTATEQAEVLKDLGFTVYSVNGRMYVK